jgi:probable phosphoglycerate mutase
VQLYLIRHGQSYGNLKEWPHGNTDEGLTELGQEQAARLAAWLPAHLPHIDALYASTMRRALETAAAAAKPYDVTVRPDDRLRELGNNRLDHTAWPNDALPPRYAEYWGNRPFAPTMEDAEGVESVMHARTRVGLFIEEIVERHRGEIVVAVCHGGVVECVFAHVFNVGPWSRCEVWAHNTAVTHFEYVDAPGARAAWRLHYHNRVEHLGGG